MNCCESFSRNYLPLNLLASETEIISVVSNIATCLRQGSITETNHLKEIFFGLLCNMQLRQTVETPRHMLPLKSLFENSALYYLSQSNARHVII